MSKNDNNQNENNSLKKIPNKFIRIILIIAGTFSVAIGIIGIFLPLLPTTPFLLLAAALYAKSSLRFYNWLLNNRLFGKYIKNYIEGKGIPLKAKILSISLLWITILYSAFNIINILFVRVILISIAIAVSIHVISIRTIKQE
jgi:hypothetical protein